MFQLSKGFLYPAAVAFTTTLVALVAMLTIDAREAEAQVQTRAQQKCILLMNKSGRRTTKIKHGDVYRCIKGASRGTVTDADACVLDPTVKLSKTLAKTELIDDAKCAGNDEPDFGFVGAEDLSNNTVDEVLGLTGATYGANLHDALTGSGSAPRCQQRVSRALTKVIDTQLKLFERCKKLGLKSNAIDSATDMAACSDAVTNDTRKLPI